MKLRINISQTIGLVLIMLMSTLIFTNCQKQRNSGSMTVKMTDAPGDYQEVNVDIVAVEVHYEDEVNDGQEWVALNINSGIYNLLDLQNDVTVVLADEDEIPVGHVTQIRLILGDDNTIMVDGIVYDLALSSQDKTGLKLNVDAKVKKWKDLEIVIDFDAGESIVLEGNGTYRLKPVLKVESLEYK